MTDDAVTPARPPVDAAPAARRWLYLAALGLLLLVVLADLAAGPALRPARSAHHQADVLAIPGVTGLVKTAQVDPTELSQVAASEQPSAPRAIRALAFLDVLLLAGALALGLPRLAPGRGARLGLFVGSLAILIGAMAVAVVAIGRLRYLVSLYLSPPVGTLSYLLLYGSFRRGGALAVLTVLMALKLAGCVALFRAQPRALSERGLAGLAITAVGATIVPALCYALAPTSLALITDALGASVVALAAVLWAGILVSGFVRRLA